MTEHCSGCMVYHYGHQTLSGETLANHAMLALAHGADVASFWQYRFEWLEQEAQNFGLLHQDGSPSERLDDLPWSPTLSAAARHFMRQHFLAQVAAHFSSRRIRNPKCCSNGCAVFWGTWRQSLHVN